MLKPISNNFILNFKSVSLNPFSHVIKNTFNYNFLNKLYIIQNRNYTYLNNNSLWNNDVRRNNLIHFNNNQEKLSLKFNFHSGIFFII